MQAIIFMICFKVGNVVIRHKGILAPMLEYTTLPYRLLCGKYNCGLTYTEMVHITHINNSQDLADIDLLASCTEDQPVAVQIVGDFTDQKETLSAVHKLDDYRYFDIIDFNLGCPSGKIMAGRGGAALLSNKYFEKAIETIRIAKQTCVKPLTVKTRLGLSENNLPKISRVLFSAGIDAIAVHARTANDNYSVKPNIFAVKNLLNTAPVPVIYNGGVLESNLMQFCECGFSGLMIGTSALGNPFIFDQINSIVTGRPLQKMSAEARLNCLSEYLQFCQKHSIEFAKIKAMSLQFVKGVAGAAKIRNTIAKSKSQDDLLKIIYPNIR